MGLLEVRGRREVAARGARLLRAKREVLAGELHKLTRQVLEGRDQLDATLERAVVALAMARALDGEPGLEALAWGAGREIPLLVSLRRVWGVATPSVAAPTLARHAGERGGAVTSWGPSASETARRHEEALEVLLRIASHELHLARLGEEIQATSRRINALEQLSLPRLEAEASRIEGALEERDREDAVRLKRFRGKAQRRRS
jgi:V/A-type H+-transporting ATPase subunit D